MILINTKYIPGFKNLSNEERLKWLNLLAMAYCRLQDMIETIKIHNVYPKLP